MPTFNSEKYISESINSIINQTYSSWELLISDDHSTDNTVEIVESYIKLDSRIQLFQLSSNQGAGVARNHSIKHSKGKYIAFCDSDDLWKPNKLEIQIDFMKKNNLAFSYSSYEIIDEQGRIKRYIKASKEISFKKMLKNNYVGCLTSIYDVKITGKLYMSKIRKRQDWLLWLKILKKTDSTKGIEQSLALLRNRSNSISSKKFQLLKYNWRVYNHELGYTKISTSFLMIQFIIYYAIKKMKVSFNSKK